MAVTNPFDSKGGTYSVKPASKKMQQFGPRMRYTNELDSALEELVNVSDDDVAFELLYLIEPSSTYYNGLDIQTVGISKKASSFSVKIMKGRIQPAGKANADMPIEKFVKYFFKNKFKDAQIKSFIRKYNLVSTGQSLYGTPIQFPQFKFDPKDVRSTFLSLVKRTCPHGNEDKLLPFLTKGLQKDQIGNYYLIIGDSPETMFASHLDTADRVPTDIKLFSTTEEGDEIISTDGKSILGADDKAGVTVMMYMIDSKVPGLYYFFLGEEVGCVGSSGLDKIFNKVSHLKNIKRCISFDRKNYHSVITKQMHEACCSDEFGKALCDEFNKNGMSMEADPTGIYTDSASFVDDIPECTNISVGYFSEHTSGEHQNISFLARLAKACTGVNWSSLPTVRKAGINPELFEKYGDLIEEVKAINYGVELKFKSGKYGGFSIQINIEYCEIDEILDTLTELSTILRRYKVIELTKFNKYYLSIDLDDFSFPMINRNSGNNPFSDSNLDVRNFSD